MEKRSKRRAGSLDAELNEEQEADEVQSENEQDSLENDAMIKVMFSANDAESSSPRVALFPNHFLVALIYFFQVTVGLLAYCDLV